MIISCQNRKRLRIFIRSLFLMTTLCYNQMVEQIKYTKNKVINKMTNKMSMDDKIKRINVLYHKSKNEGLSIDEKNEQQELRSEYIASVRGNLRGQLDNIELIHPDGSKTSLTPKETTKHKNESN